MTDCTGKDPAKAGLKCIGRIRRARPPAMRRGTGENMNKVLRYDIAEVVELALRMQGMFQWEESPARERSGFS